MIEFIDKTGVTAGTKINRANMMGIQGYQSSEVVFRRNSITEYFDEGFYETTTFEDDKIIKEFHGTKNIKQTISFTENGYAKEIEYVD